MSGSFKLGKNLSCHRGDDHLFINHSGGYTSISLSSKEVKYFIGILVESTYSKKYFEYNNYNSGLHNSGLHISLEDEDDQRRNICFIDTRLYLAINVKVKIIPEFVKFLKQEWNII